MLLPKFDLKQCLELIVTQGQQTWLPGTNGNDGYIPSTV